MDGKRWSVLNKCFRLPSLPPVSSSHTLNPPPFPLCPVPCLSVLSRSLIFSLFSFSFYSFPSRISVLSCLSLPPTVYACEFLFSPPLRSLPVLLSSVPYLYHILASPFLQFTHTFVSALSTCLPFPSTSSFIMSSISRSLVHTCLSFPPPIFS